MNSGLRFSGNYSGRQLKKNISRMLFGIDSVDSWGLFQQNMAYVTRYLDGYPMDKLYYQGKSDLSNAAVGSARRDELSRRLKATGWVGRKGDTTPLKTIAGWRSLDAKEKRVAVADMLEGCSPFSLFFANLLYSENKKCFAEQARTTAGLNFSAIDLEMTCVLAHNRGMGRTNFAIFQQNLLVAALNISKQPGSPQKIRALASRFFIDGYPGEGTLALFKEICSFKRIETVHFGKQDFRAEDISEDDLKKWLVDHESRYKNAFAFFSMPQFTKSDFMGLIDKKNFEPYPTLSHSLANSKAYSKHFTNYVKDYCFFTEPLNTPAEKEVLQSLSAKASNGKISIQYAIPTSPGLVSISVKSAPSAKKPYEYVFMEDGSPGAGAYHLSTPGVPPGEYIVILKVGIDKMEKTVKVMPLSPHDTQNWFYGFR